MDTTHSATVGWYRHSTKSRAVEIRRKNLISPSPGTGTDSFVIVFSEFSGTPSCICLLPHETQAIYKYHCVSRARFGFPIYVPTKLSIGIGRSGIPLFIHMYIIIWLQKARLSWPLKYYTGDRSRRNLRIVRKVR